MDRRRPEIRFPQDFAFVGESGAGKTTLVQLISRFYDVSKGSICIGGMDIGDAPSEQVLSYISLVEQDVFLFNDTVSNNIRYAGPDAADEEIRRACALTLSGGERQRLSIARAIQKDSPIILLDEATASLDIENELLVKQAAANLLKADKTVVMIAHTLPIIRNADKIFVLDHDRIAESGAHEELLENGGKNVADVFSAFFRLKIFGYAGYKKVTE